MPFSAAELARYSRHLSLSEFGLAGQEKLKAARVVVVGAGGLGSPALLYLAAAGIGTLGVVDFDRVDISNLQRQVLFNNGDVNKSKSVVAAEHLRALNQHLDVNVHELELTASNVINILSDYDVVLDGTDRFVTRYLINDACVLLRKPLVSAAIHRFEGQALTYVPGQGPCYRCLFPQPPADDLVANCATAGVLGVLPGVMGAIQATEAIKLIAGIGTALIGRLLTYDALEMSFSEFSFMRRTDCAVCGDVPAITTPQAVANQCTVANIVDQFSITVSQLQILLRVTSPAELQLVDVREPYEFATGHLPNAINVPLASLEKQLDSFSQVKRVIFVCRSGARSNQACLLAAQAGLSAVMSLAGGLQQWNNIAPASERCRL